MANKLIVGVNDFESWCKKNDSEMLNEWDYDNNSKKPSEIQYGSSIKVFWKCKIGHSYMASLNKRTSCNTGCPYCCGSHAKLLVGFNDLETTNPEIIKMWDYEKNKDLKPSDVMKGQNKKVWWIGECGHSWEASINHIIGGRGCPICRKEAKTSFPEQAIYYYVKKYYPDAINGDRHLGKELDIYIPSLNIGIEYDGQRWHEDRKKDEEKNQLCYKNGIRLIRIREKECWFWTENEYLQLIPCKSADEKELKNAISVLFILLNGPIFLDININEDKINIFNQYIKAKKENSLLNVNPTLAMEWNTSKNGKLTPDMVTANSGKKVWWIGKCGHEWEAQISSRNRTKSGCPYCNGKRLLKGENDLATLKPDLLKEWDYNKNMDSPSNYTIGSSVKVWWLCSKCGSSYQMTINNKCKGHGCSFCAREKVRQKYLSGEIKQRKPIRRADSSSHKKKVINIDTGKSFNSIKEAGEYYGINPCRISECCSGKRKTAGGYCWNYYDDFFHLSK